MRSLFRGVTVLTGITCKIVRDTQYIIGEIAHLPHNIVEGQRRNELEEHRLAMENVHYRMIELDRIARQDNDNP